MVQSGTWRPSSPGHALTVGQPAVGGRRRGGQLEMFAQIGLLSVAVLVAFVVTGRAAVLTQVYLAGVLVLVLPRAISAQHTAARLDQITTDARRFRHNFTQSLVGMAFLEPAADGTDLRITDLNETAAEILGGTSADFLGHDLRRLVDAGAQYEHVLPRLLSGSMEGWRTECALLGARPVRLTLQLSLLSTPGDRPLWALQLIDVTAQYQARRDLELAQQLTATTLDTTACIIMVVDLDGTVVRVNAATSTLTGYREGDLLGRLVWETGVTPREITDLDGLMAWLDLSGAPAVHEGDARTCAGETLRVVWSTSVVPGDADRPWYAVLTGTDVTAERTTRGLVNHLMEASFATALVGVDTAGRISLVNSGLTHLLGYDRTELVGRPFHVLMNGTELRERTGADSLTEAFATLVRGLGAEGETRPRDWTWVTRSGSDKLVSMSLSVASDALTAQGGYLCVARDVTENRQSQEMLIAALDKERTAVERLRALDPAKNPFGSTVSHELRTPVTSIVGYAEMMMDGTLVQPLPDQLPLLSTIGRNGQRLISMINDLLLLGGFDSGSVHARHDAIDLTAALGPIEESVRALLVGRDLRLDVIRPASPVQVIGDPNQLERVLTNLVSNAVKFTDDGGWIQLRLGTEADQAVIRVSDDGIGIPAGEQAELFQRFFRSSTAQTRQIQGTGLGLSIVSEIVAGHGGTIEIVSGHLQGSTFTVRLPLASSDQLTLTA